MTNSIVAIRPHLYAGMWVFTDEARGLINEPFVDGIPEIIELATAGLKEPEKGFTLLFSATPFPSHKYVLKWLRPEHDGNWYQLEGTEMRGWLCPQLFSYFDKAPERIYCSVK